MKEGALAGGSPSHIDEPEGGRAAWWVLAVLIVAYTFSFLDRQALTLMVAPIKASLDITDTQLSLLHGFAFALFYSVLGLPIGQLVDRRRRTTIVAVGVVVWSLMTAVCGLSRNFMQLFLARVGVGVGEAALSPAAYSLLGDSFPARRLPLAMSIYNSSISLGAGLATIIGGAVISAMPAVTLPVVGHLEPWQGVFIAIGLPGVLVALVVLSLREPRRTRVKAQTPPSLGATFSHIFAYGRTYGLLMMAAAMCTLFWNGGLAWYPTYFMRVFEWTTAEVGTRYGLTILVSGVTGAISGGALAGWLRARGVIDANIRVGLVACAVAVPAGVASGLVGSPWAALALVFLFQFGCTMPFGGLAAALQEITPNQMRGQVSAVYLFMANLFGIGLGPTVVALFTDHVFADEQLLGYSIAATSAIAGPLAALLFWLDCRPYREVQARLDF